MKTDEEIEHLLARLAQVVHERAVLEEHARRHEALAEVLAARETEQLARVLSELEAAGYPTLQLDGSEEQERRAIEDPETLQDEIASMVSNTGVRVLLKLKRSPSILRRPTRRITP